MIFKIDKIEELLTANWTNFTDTRQFMLLILNNVRDNKSYFNKIIQEKIPAKFEVAVSRITFTETGLLLWADFTVPQGDKETALGTCSILIRSCGRVECVEIVGSLVTAGS